MADFEGCERNPFARDVFKAQGSLPEKLNDIKTIVSPYRFDPLRYALLNS